MSLPSKKKLAQMFKYYEGKRKPIFIGDETCPECGSAETIERTVEVDGKKQKSFVCDECGHAQLGATSEDLAQTLRVAMEQMNNRKKVDAVLDLANKLLDGHGVEAIRGDYHVDNYYYDIVGLYVNMGDTYIPTLLYDTDRGKFYVGGWGDWVEANQKRYNIL